MAFAFEIQPTVVGFNLDRPEEIILIHHFEMAESLTPDDQILVEFSRKFFEEGKGVSEIDFDHIIELAKRVSVACKGLAVKPSGRTDYMQTRDKAKSDLRKETRAKLAQRGGSQLLSDAYEQLAELPTPLADDARQQKVLFDLYQANSKERRQTGKAFVLQKVIQQDQTNRPYRPEANEQPDMSGVDVIGHMGGDPSENRIEMPSGPKVPSNSEVLRMVQGDISSMQKMMEILVEQVNALTREIQDLKLERNT